MIIVELFRSAVHSQQRFLHAPDYCNRVAACRRQSPLRLRDTRFADTRPQNAAAEAQWEQKFRELPDRDHIRENMRRLSARPHHVGSPYDKDNAEWLLAQLKSYGLNAQIEQFSALFPTPKSRKLELLGPTPFTAKLQEPVISVDPTSNQTSEQLPTYNAYSRDGDVTAPLVYVNYGRPEDYDDTGSDGRLGEGRHRDRALRPELARHQAKGGGRARRGGMHHLLRPAR